MRSKIGGHPIHPLLVVFPIGLWVFAFISQIVELSGGGHNWSVLATYTMAGGLIGGAIAAIFGAIDLTWLSKTRPNSRAKRIGVLHMSLNLVVIALFLIAFLIRAGGNTLGAGQFILSLLAIGTLGVSGWLGNTLVYLYGVSVEGGGEERYRETGRGGPATVT